MAVGGESAYDQGVDVCLLVSLSRFCLPGRVSSFRFVYFFMCSSLFVSGLCGGESPRVGSISGFVLERLILL